MVGIGLVGLKPWNVARARLVGSTSARSGGQNDPRDQPAGSPPNLHGVGNAGGAALVGGGGGAVVVVVVVPGAGVGAGAGAGAALVVVVVVDAVGGSGEETPTGA